MIFLKNIFLTFFVFGIFVISNIFSQKIFSKKNNLENIFLFFIIIIIFISVILFFLLFNDYQIFLNISYFNTLIAIIPFLFYKTSIGIFKNFSKELKKRENFFFIFYFFSLYLLCLLPVSDPDSLDYHLGIPKILIEENSFSENINWLHFQLASYGEMINLISIISFDGKLLGFLKVTLLLFLTILLLRKYQKNSFLIKFFLISPIFLFFILSQKPQFFGFLIFSIVLFIMFENKKNKFFFHHFCFYIVTAYTAALNYSFLTITLLFCLYFLFFFKKFYLKNKIFFSVISFLSLLILLQIYYKNLYFYGNPLTPFFENFLSQYPKNFNINFSNYLKNFGYPINLENVLLFPLRFFIPLNIQDLTTTYAPLIVFILFIKKSKKLHLIYLFFLITTILVIMLTSQISNRYYFITYLFVLYFLMNCSYNYSKNLERFSNFTLFSFSFLLLTYLLMNIGSLFNEDKQSVFLKKNAYQYEETIWLKEKININTNFTSDIRSKSLLDQNHKTIHFLFYVEKKNFNKEFFKFIKKNNISLFSFESEKDTHFLYELLSDCKNVLFSKKFQKKRRNFLTEKKFIKREIFELDLNNKNCKLQN